MSNPTSVLITGTSSGFGFLTAKTLVQRGCTVFASMRDVAGRNAEAAAALRDAAAAGPGTLQVVELDVTSDESVARAAAQVLEQGELDVLVNNAGFGTMLLVESFTAEQVRKLFDTNVIGTHRTMKAVLPRMRARGQGLVINVSSGLGRIVLPFLGPYGATKFALEALSDAYRYELAPTGVEVCVVEPGPFPTDFMSNALQPGDPAVLASSAPVVGMAQAMYQGLAAMFEGKEPPNPQLVADAIADAIAKPLGQRPQRIVVDALVGQVTESINQFLHGVQTQLLTGMQFDSLLQASPKTLLG